MGEVGGRDLPVRIEADGDDSLIWVKVVPGASGDEIAGALADRLKVRVSAPAEKGRANRLVCRLLAGVLAVRPGDVVVDRGATSAAKTVRVRGLGVAAVRRRLSR